jgi:competence protein ComEC
VTRLLVATALLAGLLLGILRPLQPGLLGLTFGGALMSAALLRARPTARRLALIAAAAALGAWRAASVPDPADAAWLSPYAGLQTRLSGTARDAPVRSAAGTSVRLQVEVTGAAPAGRPPVPPGPSPAPVTILVLADPARLDSVGPGDSVVLEGLLGDGPTLLFPRLLAREPPPPAHVAAQLATLRVRAEHGIRAALPEPHASLAAGVLLGGSGKLDADFRLQLQRSGLAHLVAIDGYKQVVVAAALGGLARRMLGFRTATLVTLAGIVLYTLLTGAHASAVRAALMVGLASLAALVGRPADSLHGLLLAAVLMALHTPRILLDLGLQLSLTATLGLILLWPQLRRYLHGLPGWLAEPAGLTFAVTIATLPLVLSVFQSVSLISPLAHVLAVPLLPLVLGGTALLALASPVPALAQAVAPLALAPTALLVEVIRWTGSVPGAALATGRPPPGLVALSSAGLLAWGIWGLPELAAVRRQWLVVRREHRLALRRAATALAALGLGLLALQLRPDHTLHLTRLEVTGGEAVLIRGPTGQTALVVDGRVDGARLATAVADALPLWAHELDLAVAVDGTARRGLAATLVRYPARQVRTLAEGGDVSPERLELGGGAVLDVLAPRRLVVRFDTAQHELLGGQ